MKIKLFFVALNLYLVLPGQVAAAVQDCMIDLCSSEDIVARPSLLAVLCVT